MRHLDRSLSWRSPVLRLLTLGALGCGEPECCEDRWPRARVVGQVRTSDGVPVAGAQVVVRPHETGCSTLLTGATPATTNGSGRYRTSFLSLVSPYTGCLEVTVTPPPASALPALTQRVEVEALGPLPQDSLVVDVVLQPAP